MENQYPEMVVKFRAEIEQARSHLAYGGNASEIVTLLHAQGLSVIQLLLVFHEATGASLADLKAFVQWWSPHGITDEAAFNNWATEVLSRSPRIPKTKPPAN